SRFIESLARIPRSALVTRFKLKVSAREIVTYGIAKDVFQRIADRDVAARLTDCDDELDLVMQVGGAWGVRHGGIVRHDCIGRLREEERRLALGILTHLSRMCRVVAADAIDASNRKAVVTAANLDGGRCLGRKDKAHSFEPDVCDLLKDVLLLVRLAPQSELFLYHAIGEAEYDGALIRLVSARNPARADEDVARPPLEHVFSDSRAPTAFDDDEDSGIRAAMYSTVKTFRQELHECCHRR